MVKPLLSPDDESVTAVRRETGEKLTVLLESIPRIVCALRWTGSCRGQRTTAELCFASL
jgi:hypothetical protein